MSLQRFILIFEGNNVAALDQFGNEGNLPCRIGNGLVPLLHEKPKDCIGSVIDERKLNAFEGSGVCKVLPANVRFFIDGCTCRRVHGDEILGVWKKSIEGNGYNISRFLNDAWISPNLWKSDLSRYDGQTLDQKYERRKLHHDVYRSVFASTLALHIGDISYARGWAYLWEYFFALIEPISTKIPYMVGIGK